MRIEDLVAILNSLVKLWPRRGSTGMATRDDGVRGFQTGLLPIQGGEIDEPFQSWIEETPPGGLSLQGGDRPAAYVVHVNGEVDGLNTPKLQAYLEEAAGSGRHIIVDLSAVTFLDLNGLRLLEIYHQRCRDRGRRLVVIAPSGMPRRIMDIVGFTQEIPVVQSRQAAKDLLSS